jgi:hypothetical protein
MSIALSSVLVSAIAFNNEPFVRSLTAALVWNPIVGSPDVFLPFKATNITNVYTGQWAIDITTAPGALSAYVGANRTPYTFDQQLSIDSITPIVVEFSTDTYDPTYVPLEGPNEDTIPTRTLYNLSLTGVCGNWYLGGSSSSITVTYDNFPGLNADFLVNYESTTRNTSFYRLVSTTPFPITVNLSSGYFPLKTKLKDWYFTTDIVLNRSHLKYNSIAEFNLAYPNFNCSTPTVCSLQVFVSAVSCVGALTGFFTPHIINLQRMDAHFINAFPVADFAAYPTYHFKNSVSYEVLDATNYTNSPGVCFYGEGHTEVINLSARYVDSMTNYIWSVGNNNTGIFNVAGNLQSNTNSVSITSALYNYPVIPITLQVCNTTIPSSAPIIGYNDYNGTPFYYPYYITTVDFSGNLLPTNTTFRNSISVVPYDATITIFNPGITSQNVFLSPDGSISYFTATFTAGLCGEITTDPCYDKYGLVWKWGNFTNCDTNYSSFVNHPSSWRTTMRSGAFPKKWRKEGAVLVDGSQNSSPIQCLGDTNFWTLSTSVWPGVVYGVTDVYKYNLRVDRNLPQAYYTVPPGTVTHANLTVTKSVTCNVNNLGTFTNDWQNKTTLLQATTSFNIYGTPLIRIYTPNRYVKLGESIFFQNLIEGANFLTQLTIDFGDSDIPTTIYTGKNVVNNFTVQYKSTGPKTITVTGTIDYGYGVIGSVTQTFTNIVTIVNEYDQIDESKFITQDSALTIPYPDEPLIAPNDNVVADNINSILTKIYDNLLYLEGRGYVYPNTTAESFGWLGTALYTTAAPATGLTWQSQDCTTNPFGLTWTELSCATNNVPIVVAPKPVQAPVVETVTHVNVFAKPVYIIDVKQDTYNFSLMNELILRDWDQVIAIDVIVNVWPGVTVASQDTSSPAMNLQPLPSISTLTLNNSGTIVGAQGASSTTTYANSTTWKVLKNVGSISVTLVGAGGAGGSAEEVDAGGAGGGGGGGGTSSGTIEVTPGETVTITVGSGGTCLGGKRGSVNNGGSGGSTYVKYGTTTLVAGGGGGGGGGSDYSGGRGGGGGSGNVTKGADGSPGGAGTGDHSSSTGGRGGGNGGQGASAFDRTGPLYWSGASGGNGSVTLSYYYNGGTAILLDENTTINNKNGSIKGGAAGGGASQVGSAIVGISHVLNSPLAGTVTGGTS